MIFLMKLCFVLYLLMKHVKFGPLVSLLVPQAPLGAADCIQLSPDLPLTGKPFRLCQTQIYTCLPARRESMANPTEVNKDALQTSTNSCIAVIEDEFANKCLYC